MTKIIQWLLLLWFAIAAAFVLIGGIILTLESHGTKASVPTTPILPDCKPKCGNAAEMEAMLKVYTAQTAAYEKQLAALKAKASAEQSQALETYKAVAKETIQPLLTTIFTALLGYVFVKGTATVVNNAILARSGQEPQKLDLP